MSVWELPANVPDSPKSLLNNWLTTDSTWKFVIDTICDFPHFEIDSSTIAFLSCERSIRLLTGAIDGFQKPSSQSKSDFETRTAAINVTPAPHGHYNIEEIKEDALWLSKEVKLDEIEALRIATIEWQNRPRDKLWEALSENERTSLQEIFGSLTFSEPLSRLLGSSNVQAISKSFLSAERRRTRLLTLYLEEQRNLLATTERLVGIGLANETLPKTSKSDLERKNRVSDATEPIRQLGKSLLGRITKAGTQEGFERHAISCIEAIQLRLDSLEAGNKWNRPEGAEVDIAINWVTSNIHELVTLSDLLLLNLRASRRISKSSTLLTWFRILCKYEFFTRFQAQSDEQTHLVSLFQLSAALTSVALLNPNTSILYLLESQARLQVEQDTDENAFYFFDRNNVSELHEMLLKLAAARIPLASPAVFAWGIVLYTIRELGIVAKETREGQQVQKAIDQSAATEHQQGRRLSSSSLGSMQQSIFEDIVDQARAVSLGEDPVVCLTQSAVDGCHVFDVIANMATAPFSSNSPVLKFWRHTTLLDLVKSSYESIGYTPEVLTAILAILDRDDHGVDADQPPEPVLREQLASAFLSDDFLMETIFDTSMARFPYEALPFLRFCKTLANVRPSDKPDGHLVAKQLLLMNSLTQVIPSGFTQYHTIREDENANLVSLDEPLGIYPPSNSMLLTNIPQRVNSNDIHQIPSGTTGQVISDARPSVVMWYHKYSGLSFLGKWLETYQGGQEAGFTYQAEPLDAVIMAIIQLFTSLVTATNQEGACSVLEEASNGMNRNSDIVLVVFEIFEAQMQSLRFKRTADGAINIVQACIEFMSIVVTILPGRVWPLLSRSSFLNVNGAGSHLLAILSTEATIGTFRFLETSVDLYTGLLEEALSRAVSQQPQSKPRENNRLSRTTDSSAPNHIKNRVLFAFTQAIAEIYDNLASSQFKSPAYQARVRIKITQAFRRLLYYGYGIDDNEDLDAKLTSATSLSAPYVLDFFRPDSPNDRNLGAMLHVLADGLQDQDVLHQEIISQAQHEQTDQTLLLCFDLIRAARLKHTVTFLERQLCRVFPVLIRLYATHARHQCSCVRVMAELVAVGSISEKDSSSLLSFLGMESSRSLLEMLSSLDQPRSNTDLYVAIWELLTALLSARQQWFAIYLLTGSSPKEKIKGTKPDATSQSPAVRGKAFLTMALDELSHIESTKGERAVAMLSFVCRAQENWSWATGSLQSHPDFFLGIMSYVGKLDVKQSPAVEKCYQYRIAGLVANLSIVYLYYALSKRNATIVQKMLPAFKWYTSNAIEISAYNVSLHANLRKNFKARYPNCDLLNFKKTTFCSSQYGEAFFYDIETAAKMLSFDPSWSGTARNTGFAHEFRLANLNLSLVDSQIQLLHSFKAMCIEHAASLVRSNEVPKPMAQIVRNCLAANSKPYPAEKIFQSIFETRMELAVGLLQPLVHIKANGSEFTTLLKVAWEATRFRNTSYEVAVSNNDLNYYRSCLNALLLCIQLHVEKRFKEPPSKTGLTGHTQTRSTALEILSNVVAHGLGQVSNTLYDQAQSQSPNAVVPELGSDSEVGLQDFYLMLSILQSSLRVPALLEVVSEVSSVFIASPVIDAALRLYSWSHRLSPPNTDPVYSTCALSFLAALSSLPPVAEDLGIEGVLNRLATSRITVILQSIPGGVGPIEPSRRPNEYPHQQRLYLVWSEGILPLCLNLLHSVGRPMAGEIANFLNQFPEQLACASNAFTYNPASKDPAAGAVSLSLASEATTLALISHVLESYRLAGPSAGVDSFEIPILNRYDEPENKKGLKADIEELLTRRASLRSRIVATSEKEFRWAKQKSADGAETQNLLEEKVVAELKRALVCLKGNEASEGES